MQHGICNLSLIPVRKSAGHTSEMVSQMLFGETFDILHQHENWVEIQIHTDHYSGWIHQLQFLYLDKADLDILNSQARVFVNDLTATVTEKSSGISFPLLMGSSLPLPHYNQFRFADQTYTFKGNYVQPLKAKENIIPFAKQYLAAPYLWGGRTHYGIDCSGFTQMVYKLSGFSLQRDASQQAFEGETLNFLSEAEAGDLLFFDNEEGNIVHVGLLLDENKIIHASGKVRIDTIDHQGIFNADLQKYTHNLRLIKKIKN
ncbi:MAG: NlpC/P60 family protein [Bacteroidales bacterium]